MITAAYPPVPISARTVSGGTEGPEGVVTASATAVTITRTARPLFVAGSAGRLVWTASVTSDQAVELVTFRLGRREVSRESTPASAVLELDAGDSEVTLAIVVECPAGTELTIVERCVQVPRVDVPITLADPSFGQTSANGVEPPAPSASLPLSESQSPARRSPQVRRAQLAGSLRPDLLPRCSSLS